MSFYNNAQRISYNMGAQTFTSAATGTILPPGGYNDAAGYHPYSFRFVRVVDIHVFVTTTFGGATTPGLFTVGVTGTTAALASLSLTSGTAVANADWGTGTAGMGPTIKSVTTTINNASLAGSYNQAQPFLDLTTSGLTFIVWGTVAPTGGGAAGAGIPMLTLDWW
jgi:hypothetical protein